MWQILLTWPIVASALSKSALVCAADTQKRTRASSSGVAGKPTVTTAKLRFNASRLKAPILEMQ